MALATVWPRKVLGFSLSLHREQCWSEMPAVPYSGMPQCPRMLFVVRLDQNWDDTDGPQRKLLSC